MYEVAKFIPDSKLPAALDPLTPEVLANLHDLVMKFGLSLTDDHGTRLLCLNPEDGDVSAKVCVTASSKDGKALLIVTPWEIDMDRGHSWRFTGGGRTSEVWIDKTVKVEDVIAFLGHFDQEMNCFVVNGRRQFVPSEVPYVPKQSVELYFANPTDGAAFPAGTSVERALAMFDQPELLTVHWVPLSVSPCGFMLRHYLHDVAEDVVQQAMQRLLQMLGHKEFRSRANEIAKRNSPTGVLFRTQCRLVVREINALSSERLAQWEEAAA